MKIIMWYNTMFSIILLHKGKIFYPPASMCICACACEHTHMKCWKVPHQDANHGFLGLYWVIVTLGWKISGSPVSWCGPSWFPQVMDGMDMACCPALLTNYKTQNCDGPVCTAEAVHQPQRGGRAWPHLALHS